MRAFSAFIIALLAAAPSWAARPRNGALGFQEPATPVMQEITDFHNMLLVLIISIACLVLALLLWVMIRYNSKVNPTPSKFSHNTLVEIVWTAGPVLILIVIAVPSFRLLYNEDVIPDGVRPYYKGEVIPAPALTIKATGRQWLWEYEYPDNGGFSFFSRLLPEDQAAPEDYKLAVDNPMVAPADTTVRITAIGADVIHDWAMPAFGIKMDAIPGRLNENWFRVHETGTYYGECSELCGLDHAFMPIQVDIVPPATFERWAAAMADGDDAGAAQILAEFKSGQGEATRLAEAR